MSQLANLFAIREVRNSFILVSVILLLFTTGVQIAVVVIAHDLKDSVIEHDYAIAGYLDRNWDKSQLTRAFLAEKTNADLTAGREILQPQAYDKNIIKTWLPEVNRFQSKYAFPALLASLLISFLILAILLVSSLRLSGKLEQASADISGFMDGSHRVCLNDEEEGSIAALFSSVNDMAASLTAHIARENQHREFLRDVVADISHQLKTPLAALKMYNEIIGDEVTDNSTVTSFIGKSENELKRIEILVQNLLKLAELDAGAVVLDKKDCNLLEFLESVTQSFRTRAEKEGKSLSLACDEQIRLHCDAEWLLEAVSNIVKNALDHTNTKDTIKILGDETPVLTSIFVKDTGRGIHPEDIHHIFKRFYRSRFSKDKQGVGIGLTLSKAIVEKHGGTILVESGPGAGTTFQLVFPKLTKV